MRALPYTIVLAGLCLLAGTATATATAGGGLTPLPDRPEAPAFELQLPGGGWVRLSDYRGRPLIVNFWATWCPPCRREMPSMQRAWEQLREEGIGFIAVNVGEEADTVARFAEQYGVELPLPIDPSSRVVQSWPVRGLPTTFVVDPQGRLAYSAAGEREWDDPALLDQVRALRSPGSQAHAE